MQLMLGNLTGKISNLQQSTAVRDHLLFVPIKLVLMIFQSLLLHRTILNLNLRRAYLYTRQAFFE